MEMSREEAIEILDTIRYRDSNEEYYVGEKAFEALTLAVEALSKPAGDEYWRGYENGRKEVISKPEDFGLCKEQKPVLTAKEAWKEMRLEVYAQASGNRHEPNCSDDSTKMFSLCDIDEIIEKIGDSIVEQKPAWSEEDEKMLHIILTDINYAQKNYSTSKLTPYDKKVSWLKALSLNLKKKNEDVTKLCSNEWSEDDETKLNDVIRIIEGCGLVESIRNHYVTFLKSLHPQPKPEQPVKTNIIEDLKHYLATTPKEQIEKDWESLKEWGKVGPTVSEFLGWKQPVELEKEIEDKIRNVFFDLNGIAIAGSSTYASVEDMVYIARHFYELGRQSKEQPVCEELGREMDRFFTSEEYEEAEKAGFGEAHAARHFAQWGAEHSKKDETPISADLEEAAKAYADYINSNEVLYTYTDFPDAFKAGAEWDRKQVIEKAIVWISNNCYIPHSTLEAFREEMNKI